MRTEPAFTFQIGSQSTFTLHGIPTDRVIKVTKAITIERITVLADAEGKFYADTIPAGRFHGNITAYWWGGNALRALHRLGAIDAKAVRAYLAEVVAQKAARERTRDIRRLRELAKELHFTVKSKPTKRRKA